MHDTASCMSASVRGSIPSGVVGQKVGKAESCNFWQNFDRVPHFRQKRLWVSLWQFKVLMF